MGEFTRDYKTARPDGHTIRRFSAGDKVELGEKLEAYLLGKKPACCKKAGAEKKAPVKKATAKKEAAEE